ncbi:hypothetical protein G7Y79_00080g100570 [Physcia stellaris]|nr:hypothetical protein G7Y79_00080g100570 [Physcia stellaris]
MANDPMDVHNGEPEEQSGAGGPGGMGMVLATSDFITSGASLDIKLDTARQRVRSKDGAFQLRRPPESSLPNNTGLNRKKEEEEEEKKNITLLLSLDKILKDGEAAETTMSQKLDNDGTATYVTGIKIELRQRPDNRYNARRTMKWNNTVLPSRSWRHCPLRGRTPATASSVVKNSAMYFAWRLRWHAFPTKDRKQWLPANNNFNDHLRQPVVWVAYDRALLQTTDQIPAHALFLHFTSTAALQAKLERCSNTPVALAMLDRDADAETTLQACTVGNGMSPG